MGKHLILANRKGGVGKSTIAHFSIKELIRLGIRVSTINTDKQKHIEYIEAINPEITVYDCAGAHTEQNIELFKAAAHVKEDVVIIIPIGVSENDFTEIDLMIETFKENNLLDVCFFCFNRVRKNDALMRIRREELETKGVNVLQNVFRDMNAIRDKLDTYTTREEIRKILREVKVL